MSILDGTLIDNADHMVPIGSQFVCELIGYNDVWVRPSDTQIFINAFKREAQNLSIMDYTIANIRSLIEHVAVEKGIPISGVSFRTHERIVDKFGENNRYYSPINEPSLIIDCEVLELEITPMPKIDIDKNYGSSSAIHRPHYRGSF